MSVRILGKNHKIAEMNFAPGKDEITAAQTFSFELEQSINDGFIRVQFEAELVGKDEAIVVISISKV